MADLTANQVDELRALLGKPVPVVIGERTVELLPFEFEQLPDVLEAVAPFLDDLVSGMSRLHLLKKHRKAVNSLVALLSKLPEPFVRGLPSFHGLRLFTGCIEANADFFSQGLPEIRKLMYLLPTKSELTVPAPTSAVPSASASAGAVVDRSRSDTGSGSPSS